MLFLMVGVIRKTAGESLSLEHVPHVNLTQYPGRRTYFIVQRPGHFDFATDLNQKRQKSYERLLHVSMSYHALLGSALNGTLLMRMESLKLHVTCFWRTATARLCQKRKKGLLLLLLYSPFV